MGLNGFGRCVKFSVLVINMLILAGALTAFSIGMWTCVARGYLAPLLGDRLYMNSAYILIAMGVAVFLVSLVGFQGAIREIKCLLFTYFMVLFLIFVIVLIGGILAYVFRAQVIENGNNAMLATISEDYDINPGIRSAWDILQKELNCCGVANGDDPAYEAWRQSETFMNPNKAPHVPESCCLRGSDGDCVDKNNCLEEVPSNRTVSTQDCYKATIELLRDHALILGGVGIAFSCMVLCGLILACMLFHAIT